MFQDRQQVPFCARCRVVGPTDKEGLWVFIQEHGVVGFLPAENPVVPVALPTQRTDDYLTVALEQSVADF